MNERNWRTSGSPARMLAFVAARAGPRKLRLYACGGARSVAHLLMDETAVRAVAVAERFADGLADDAELGAAQSEAREVAARGWALWDEGQAQATEAAAATTDPQPYRAALRAAEYAVAARLAETGEQRGWRAGRRHLSALARDVFGDPFGPEPVIDLACLAWQGGAVVQLATAIYEAERFA